MTDQICSNIASKQGNVPAAQDAQAAKMRSSAKSVVLTIDRVLPVQPLTYMAVSMLSSGWEMKSASNVTDAVSVEPMDISTHWALAFDRSGPSDNHQSMRMVSPVVRGIDSHLDDANLTITLGYTAEKASNESYLTMYTMLTS